MCVSEKWSLCIIISADAFFFCVPSNVWSTAWGRGRIGWTEFCVSLSVLSSVREHITSWSGWITLAHFPFLPPPSFLFSLPSFLPPSVSPFFFLSFFLLLFLPPSLPSASPSVPSSLSSFLFLLLLFSFYSSLLLFSFYLFSKFLFFCSPLPV